MDPTEPGTPRRRAKRRFRLIALLLTVLVCAGLGEAALRLVLGKRLAPLYEEDEASLYRLIPKTDKLVQRPDGDEGGPVEVHVNADGFRGPELRAHGEARRVMVYGDSCTLALFSDPERTFPARLGEELGRRLPGRPIEAVNAGVAGYGPDQELSRMERELPRYRPDLAIVALFADNDMGDLLRNRMYRLDGRGQLVRGRPVLNDTLTEQFKDARTWLLSKAASKAFDLVRGDHAGEGKPAEAPADTALRLRAEEFEEYARGENVVRNLFDDGYDADVSCEPDGEAARTKVALLTAIVGRMAEVCREAGIPLAILVIPTPSDVCHGRPGYDTMRIDPTRFPKYDPQAITKAMAGAAAAHGIPCVDLFDVFAKSDDPTKLYYRDDDHWNGAGQALAAARMADFLLGRGLIQ